ncbi:MAG: PKD domain-containing protein [Pseudomonadota bacterium]
MRRPKPLHRIDVKNVGKHSHFVFASIVSRAREFALQISIMGICLAVTACGRSTPTADEDIYVYLSDARPSVKLGESVTIVVDISSSEVGPVTGFTDNVSVAGFNIDMPETEARIDIATARCTTGSGSTSCQEWTFSPALDATPGTYSITVEPALPNVQSPTRSSLLVLEVRPNPSRYSAPAAVSVFGSGAPRYGLENIHGVRTSDNKRWSWSTGGVLSNRYATTGVNSYPLVEISTTADARIFVGPDSVFAAALDPFTDWVDMDFSNSLALGISSNGAVLSWGNNTEDLGRTKASGSAPIRLPTMIPNVSQSSQVAVAYTGVLTKDWYPSDNSEAFDIEVEAFALVNGSVQIWGENPAVDTDEPIFGEIKARETIDGIVTGVRLSDIEQIDAGDAHVLARRSDGTVWVWGSNANGQYGDGGSSTAFEGFVENQGFLPEPISLIAADGDASMAVGASGAAYAWGGGIGDSVVSVDGFNGPGAGEKSAARIAPYDICIDRNRADNSYEPCIRNAATNDRDHETQQRAALISENDNSVWITVWERDRSQSSYLVPGLKALALESGYAVDTECGMVTLPDGATSQSGFVWDLSVFPEDPPALLPIFGKNDPACSNRLFIATVGQGTVSVSPTATATNTTECSAGICVSSYRYDTQTPVQLTAMPAAGWVLDPRYAWSGTDECAEVALSGIPAPLNVNVTVQGGTQCIAKFVESGEMVELSISVTGNGRVTDSSGLIDCPGACIASFPAGLVDLTPVADAGWVFSDWSGDLNCDDRLILREDTSCTANFIESSQLVDLSISVSGNGRVIAPAGEIECPGVCTDTFLPDSVVDLQTQADTGWVFDRWSGDAACADQITMIADTVCTAEFIQTTSGPVLTVTILGGPGAGMVSSNDTVPPTMDCINSATPETTCLATFPLDSTVELIPSPFGTNTDVQWTGCDTDIGIEGCTLLMSGDRTVTATFTTGSSGSNTPPEASFRAIPDIGVTTQTEVTFDASASSDSDGTIDPVGGYRWDFDSDGAIDATGITTTFTYASQGTYTVTLEVVDDDGATDTSNVVLTVQDAEMTLTILGGPNAGNVSSSDGPPSRMDCTNLNETETTCSAVFAPGIGVTLLPSPTVGGGDVQWTGCDNDIGIEGCSLTMSNDRSVTATFVPPP